MITGILVLLSAISLSILSGYISIIGMTALFPGGGIQIILMMATLEVSKIFVTLWIHKHWHNSLVNFAHRAYLIFAVLSLMLLTSIGIFGYLSRSHLDQEAPMAGIDIQIEQVHQKIDQIKVARKNLDDRKVQLDQSLATVLKNSKKASDAKTAQKITDAQRKDRDQLTAAMASKDAESNELSDQEAKLKLQSSEVAAKLGPIKYLATTFGISNPNFAVEAVIVLITLVFDPLAILLFLAGIISFESDRKKPYTDLPETAPLSPPLEPAALADDLEIDMGDKDLVLSVPEPVPEIEPEIESEPAPEIISEAVAPQPEPFRGPVALGFSITSPLMFAPLVTPESPVEPPEPMVASPLPEAIEPPPAPAPSERVNPQKSVKEQLVELLELNPLLLQSIIDTVIETKGGSPLKVTPALENYEAGADPKPEVQPVPSSQWLTKPWF